MDWLRRNWPDLLIGIALIAVIAGIIATLLGGGSFFAPSNSSNNRSSPVSPSTPIAPIDSTNSDTPNTPIAIVPTPTEVVFETGTLGNTSDTTGAFSTSTIPAETNAISPTATPTPSNTTSTNIVDMTSSPTTSTESTSVSTGAVEIIPVAPTRGIQIQPSSIQVAPANSSSYKISLGAFNNIGNANSLADQLRALSYPVAIEPRNNLQVVYVGPIASAGQAEQIAAQLERAGYSTWIYTAVADVVRSTPDTNPQPINPISQPQPISQPTVSPTSALPSYLQVGAFSNAQSALEQQRVLEGLGFFVYERRQDGMIKLLVGPYVGDQLNLVRNQLLAQGIQNFPVR